MVRPTRFLLGGLLASCLVASALAQIGKGSVDTVSPLITQALDARSQAINTAAQLGTLAASNAAQVRRGERCLDGGQNGRPFAWSGRVQMGQVTHPCIG